MEQNTTVFGVFHTPDFNEELYSTKHLFLSQSSAEAAMRKVALDCYGPFDSESGYETEEDMVQSYLTSRQFNVQRLTVKE